MQLNKPQPIIASMLILVTCVVLCLFPFSPVYAHVTASGNGRISGQLLDGSNKNAPIAGQQVTLQMAQGNNAQDLKTATTDAHGAYVFSNLATDKTISYALYIRYQGAQYTSDIVTLDSKPVQQVNLTVYQATSATTNIAILRATVLLHAPDPQKKTFTVSEAFAFKNLDNRTFVGSLDTSKGRPLALFFSLPQGARGISLEKGFDGYKSIGIDGGFASNVALPPGDSEFAFSFEVPYNGSTYDFRYQALYPTVELLFMVPPEVHASSGSLTAQGTVTSNQRPYQLFETTKLLAKQEVHLGLEGLPTPAASVVPAALNTANIWLIAGVLLMLAALFVTWFLYRSTRRQGSAKRQKDGKGLDAKIAEDGGGAAKEAAEKDPRRALLAELLELDKAYEAGKLKKAVYQERRAKTKARLRALMSEQEISRR